MLLGHRQPSATLHSAIGDSNDQLARRAWRHWLQITFVTLVRTPLQAIIGNYAVPILEDKQVWGTSDDTCTAYLDSQDVARMALAALRCSSLAYPNCYNARR